MKGEADKIAITLPLVADVGLENRGPATWGATTQLISSLEQFWIRWKLPADGSCFGRALHTKIEG